MRKPGLLHQIIVASCIVRGTSNVRTVQKQYDIHGKRLGFGTHTVRYLEHTELSRLRGELTN